MTKTIEHGTRIYGGAWDEGRQRSVEPMAHRFAARDDRGLGIALCGLRQEDRSNGWWLKTYRTDLPLCEVCESRWLLH